MKNLFIVIDHGLALGYFFQTNLTQFLVEAGLRLVFIVKDSMLNSAKKLYMHDNVFFEPHYFRLKPKVSTFSSIIDVKIK